MDKPVYEWIAAGEEWSEPWGGSSAQWYGSILPRIHFALPAQGILEIGSGFGRWSYYLREHGDHLHLVDPDPGCMEASRSRFGPDNKISYHLNSGDNLDMVSDASIDLIFSFDSLVHVRRTTLERYAEQFASKLTRDGLAFIHHSNLGAIASSAARRARALLRGRKTFGEDHQRNPEMSADLFREICEGNGLKVVSQEIVNWRGRRLIDCFSTVARADSKWQAAGSVYRNPDFMREAALIRRRARHYPKLQP
ncbi:MAG TPA: class I SAM-dependent methyltransferase [Chthoniobacterales bacterium]|jgi:SAM-dependent methyltransferase|nr:class I SAM-dependent methyltransferase [Chthoniobacterales bacterium]